jgi:hypothetical protein
MVNEINSQHRGADPGHFASAGGEFSGRGCFRILSLFNAHVWNGRVDIGGRRSPQNRACWGDVPMKIGLFIPCDIDAVFPGVGMATLEFLERLRCSVEHPLERRGRRSRPQHASCGRSWAGTAHTRLACGQRAGSPVAALRRIARSRGDREQDARCLRTDQLAGESVWSFLCRTIGDGGHRRGDHSRSSRRSKPNGSAAPRWLRLSLRAPSFLVVRLGAARCRRQPPNQTRRPKSRARLIRVKASH